MRWYRVAVLCLALGALRLLGDGTVFGAAEGCYCKKICAHPKIIALQPVGQPTICRAYSLPGPVYIPTWTAQSPIFCSTTCVGGKAVKTGNFINIYDLTCTGECSTNQHCDVAGDKGVNVEEGNFVANPVLFFPGAAQEKCSTDPPDDE